MTEEQSRKAVDGAGEAFVAFYMEHEKGIHSFIHGMKESDSQEEAEMEMKISEEVMEEPVFEPMFFEEELLEAEKTVKNMEEAG